MLVCRLSTGGHIWNSQRKQSWQRKPKDLSVDYCVMLSTALAPEVLLRWRYCCLYLAHQTCCQNLSCLMIVLQLMSKVHEIIWHLLHVFAWTQAHAWFKGMQWEQLYQMEAAFKPEVTCELDTQNFEKFEEVWFANPPFVLVQMDIWSRNVLIQTDWFRDLFLHLK